MSTKRPGPEVCATARPPAATLVASSTIHHAATRLVLESRIRHPVVRSRQRLDDRTLGRIAVDMAGAGASAQFRGRVEQAVRYLCLLYTSPSPRDGLLSRMPSSA